MKDSGIEWIGEIPKHWIVSKIKKVSKIIDGDRGNEYPNDKDIVEVGVPFISTASLTDKYIGFDKVKYIRNDKFDKLRNGKLTNNDIIMSVRGSIGKTSIFTSKYYDTGFINAQMMILRFDNFTEYYYYFLNTHGLLDYINLLSYGTAQKQLSNKILSELELMVPPFIEQEEICKFIISKEIEINNLITKKQKLITQLETYKKSLIYECVTGKKEVGLSYAY